jgi:hypothetical protein
MVACPENSVVDAKVSIILDNGLSLLVLSRFYNLTALYWLHCRNFCVPLLLPSNCALLLAPNHPGLAIISWTLSVSSSTKRQLIQTTVCGGPSPWCLYFHINDILFLCVWIADVGDKEDVDQPVFSLVTGKYRHAKRYGQGTSLNSHSRFALLSLSVGFSRRNSIVALRRWLISHTSQYGECAHTHA